MQIMFYGKNIAENDVTVSNNIVIKDVKKTENPNYLFVAIDTKNVTAQDFVFSCQVSIHLPSLGIPLLMVSVFANALMAALGIGLKVATLPVVSLAVGIGVDYGIYIYDLLQQHVKQGLSVRQAYVETLRRTGKAVIFTGVCLTGSVATWIFSDLQFQRDMGELLMFMFAANMLGAVLLAPALFRMFARQRA